MLRPDPLPVVAVALSVLGLAGFVFLFVRNFNIYWLILSPVIFVVYQFPAFVVFSIYKKKRGRREGQNRSDERTERGPLIEQDSGESSETTAERDTTES